MSFSYHHTDIHGGNILISDNGELSIVDWDNPILALKERDAEVFYEGYGKTEINLAVLTYYRYERIIEDLAVIGEQLLLSDEGRADRERSYRWFTSNFEPGSTIEIAKKTDQVSGKV